MCSLENVLASMYTNRWWFYPLPHPQDIDRSGVRSPSPNLNTSLLKSVLLGNEIEDDLGPQDRIRVSSISGRPVRQDGVGIVIGNESSSESEDEADDACKCMQCCYIL